MPPESLLMFVENQILLNDCLEVLPTLKKESVDLVLTDLPYGQLDCKWDVALPLEQFFKETLRVCKPNAPIVLTARQPFTTKLINAGKQFFRYELIWCKTKGVGFLDANRQPLRAHESILVFSKKRPIYFPQKTEGEPSTHSRNQKDFQTRYQGYGGAKSIDYNNESGERYPLSWSIISNGNYGSIHPTQKPVTLFEYLIKTYTNEENLVLDCCSGSGTTAIAAINTNRRFICIEKDLLFWQKSRQRIENHIRK